jgi:hypothetical protein
MRRGPSSFSHGGVRPFYQKANFITQSASGPYTPQPSTLFNPQHSLTLNPQPSTLLNPQHSSTLNTQPSSTLNTLQPSTLLNPQHSSTLNPPQPSTLKPPQPSTHWRSRFRPDETLILLRVATAERNLIELTTSDGQLKASREGRNRVQCRSKWFAGAMDPSLRWPLSHPTWFSGVGVRV